MNLPPASSISSILLGGAVALVSTASFAIDLINTRNTVALAIDIIVMSISYLTVWQGIKYTSLDQIATKNANTAFDTRVEPLIKLLTETAGKVDSLQEDILRTDRKVDTTLDYVMKSQNMDASKAMIVPGVSFKFISKLLVLIMFSFASLVYISSYPLGIVHYFIAVIYISWWFTITSEYKQFNNTVAWVWGIAPVLIIPSVGIIMSAIYGLNIMIGILYLFLFIYIYTYFAWASYVTTGYKLIDMKPIVYMIRNRLKKDKKEAETKYFSELQELVK